MHEEGNYTPVILEYLLSIIGEEPPLLNGYHLYTEKKNKKLNTIVLTYRRTKARHQEEKEALAKGVKC